MTKHEGKGGTDAGEAAGGERGSPPGCAVERREFGIALVSLGAAALLGLPGRVGASIPTRGWESVLARLGAELASARPTTAGAAVFTESGWLLAADEAEACRRLHERLS